MAVNTTNKNKKKGKDSISKDQWVRMGNGLQQRYSSGAVTGAALSGDREAAANARRVMAQNSTIIRSTVRGEKVAQALAHTEHQQVSYLVSIDQTLKDMRSIIERQNAVLKKVQAENVALRHQNEARQTAMVVRKKSTKRAKPINAVAEKGEKGKDSSGGIFDEITDGIKNLFTVSNLLKYAAPVGVTAFDAGKGSQKAEEWGTHPLISALGGALGGTADHGSGLQALNKATTLGTIGYALKGPMGALMGIIIGGISGWIGGKQLSQFVQDTIEHAPKAIMEKIKANITSNTNELKNMVMNKMEDTWDNLKEMGENLIALISDTFTSIYAGLKSKMGSAFKALGAATGIDVLKNAGDHWEASAQATRDQLEKEAKERENAHKARRAAREDERAKKRNTQDIEQKSLNDATELGNVAVKAGFRPISLRPEEAKGIANDAKALYEGGKKMLGFGDKEEKPSTSPTKADNREKIQPDLSVGDVPGTDIKEAAMRASTMYGDNKVRVPAEALASIVAQESNGRFNQASGDGGKSKGVTHMQQDALDTVNRNFKTTFSQDEIKRDYKQALLAAALYMKIQLSKNKGNVKAALKGYNGDGPMAEKYSDETSARMDALKQPTPTPSLQPPEPKKTGATVQTASVEVQDAKREKAAPAAAPSVVQSNVNVVQKKMINGPIPSTRNDEPTLAGTLYR
jgi:hypothetical protein